MTASSRLGCANFRHSLELNRRGLLKIGALGAGGLTLSSLLRAEGLAAAAGLPVKRDTSVIILWMRGGPSQLDMWDMKPEAPIEIRGEFSPIATKVPGIQLSELLPLSAARMDRWSIIRSMHFRAEDGQTDHSSGDQVCFTGYPAGNPPDANVYPSVGSVTKRQLQHLDPSLPTYVMIPRNVPGTAAGYLGQAWEPFETLSDPANANAKFSVPNLAAPDSVSVDRISSRKQLLSDLDQMRREVDRAGQMDAMDAFARNAWEMITGPAAQKAFDLEAEPAEVRERYGFNPHFVSKVAGGDCPNWAQRMLLARRLVEAGVRIVTVDCRWWDTHEDNFNSLRSVFLPRWDQAYTALLDDLHDRGLLEKTLVVAWGEMGRTPRINANGGRDHWSKVMSVAVAGGGVQGGRVVGSSDQHAAEPKDNPKIVQDMLATIYRHLGIDTKAQYLDRAGRPHPVLPCGAPIGELFS